MNSKFEFLKSAILATHKAGGTKVTIELEVVQAVQWVQDAELGNLVKQILNKEGELSIELVGKDLWSVGRVIGGIPEEHELAQGNSLEEALQKALTI